MAEVILGEFKFEMDDLLKQTAELRKRLAAVKDEQKELRKAGQEGSEQFEQNAQEARALSKAISDNTRVLQANQKANSQRSGEIEKLRARLTVVTSQWTKLTKEERENTKVGQDLVKEKKALTEQLKTLEQETGDYRRSVGDYTNSILDAANQTGAFGGQLGTLPQLLNAAKGGIGTVVASFKTLRGAIAATGIGALLLALGSLVQFFTKTERGAQVLRVATAGLEAGFAAITDVVISFGESLFNAITNPRQALDDFADAFIGYFNDNIKGAINDVIDGFGLLGTAIKQLFAGELDEALDTANDALGKFGESGKKIIEPVTDGVKNLVEGVVNLGTEIVNDASAAADLEAALNRVIVAERALRVATAESRAEVNALKLIAEDTTQTYEDRIKAAEQAFAIEQAALDAQLANESERLRILQAQAALSESDEETLNAIADQEVLIAGLREQSFTRQVELQNKLNALRVAQQAEFTAAEKEVADATQKRFADNIKAAEKANQEYIKAEQARAAAEKEIAEKTVENRKASAQEILTNAKEALDEESAAYKAIKTSETLISTYESAQKAYASLVGIPVVGPALATVAAAAATAFGLKQVSDINGVKLAKGGIIGGQPHSSGGTKFVGSDGSRFEAERDELLVVVNKRATSRIKQLGMINSLIGGGIPFHETGIKGNYFADGGIFDAATNSNLSSELQALNFERTIANMPAPIVVVDDINRGQQRKVQVQNAGRQIRR